MSQPVWFSKFSASGRLKRGEIIKDSIVWNFKMWPLAVLTGDHISRRFFFL